MSFSFALPFCFLLQPVTSQREARRLQRTETPEQTETREDNESKARMQQLEHMIQEAKDKKAKKKAAREKAAKRPSGADTRGGTCVADLGGRRSPDDRHCLQPRARESLQESRLQRRTPRAPRERESL